MLEDHCADLVVSGEVIEYKNTEKKTSVLYPRFKPFLVEMPGTGTIIPGQQKVTTNIDLRGIVYRGDAGNVAGIMSPKQSLATISGCQ